MDEKKKGKRNGSSWQIVNCTNLKFYLFTHQREKGYQFVAVVQILIKSWLITLKAIS